MISSKATLLLGAIIGVYLAHLSGYWFLNDDAFISFRYAWNWAEHGEVVYNLGERVEGYTNFLWTAFMAGIHWLGGDIPSWSQWLSVGMGIGILIQVWIGSKKLLPHPLERLCGVLLLSLSPAFACWSTGGLEVMCFTFFLTLATLSSVHLFYAFFPHISALSSDLDPTPSSIQSSSYKYPILCGSAFALTALTRPEGLLFFGLFGLHQILNLCRSRRLPSRHHWLWGAGFTLIYLPYFAWRFQYYGYLFPNTYYVKAGQPAFWQAGSLYLWSWLSTHLWLFLCLIPIYTFLRNDQKLNRICHPFGLISFFGILLSVHVAHVGGDFMALHRFMVPIMPLLALVCASPLCKFIQFTHRYLTTGIALKPSLIIGLWIALFGFWGGHTIWIQKQALKVGSSKGIDSIGWLNQFVGQCREVGLWLNQNTPPQTRLATTAAGVIAYYSQRSTVDLLGLNDEWVAHSVKPRGQRPGHTKSAPFLYPIQKQVNYLIYHPHFSSRPSQAHPRFQKALSPHGYQWKTIHLPKMKPQWWGVWVKTSSSDP